MRMRYVGFMPLCALLFALLFGLPACDKGDKGTTDTAGTTTTGEPDPMTTTVPTTGSEEVCDPAPDKDGKLCECQLEYNKCLFGSPPVFDTEPMPAQEPGDPCECEADQVACVAQTEPDKSHCEETGGTSGEPPDPTDPNAGTPCKGPKGQDWIIDCMGMCSDKFELNNDVCQDKFNCLALDWDGEDCNCGNGILDANEQCDSCKGKNGDLGCTAECKWSAKGCGNGTREGAEQCDLGPGYNGPNEACLEDCTVNEKVCGNGKFEPELGEMCDDGNNQGGDSCEANCTLLWPDTCMPPPTPKSKAQIVKFLPQDSNDGESSGTTTEDPLD